MMKLANEIVNDLSKAGCMLTRTAPDLIVEKLQPIKSLIARANDFSRSAGCKAALIEALEMLEEEK